MEGIVAGGLLFAVLYVAVKMAQFMLEIGEPTLF